MLASNHLIGFGAGGSFAVTNSATFNGTDEEMTLTPAGAGDGGGKIHTIAFWVNPTSTGVLDTFFSVGTSGANVLNFRTEWGASAYVNWTDANPSNRPQKVTNYDISTGWQHWCYVYDSTQGTAADRCRIYKDGTEVTTWATADVDPNLNDVSLCCGTSEHAWMNDVASASHHRAGKLAEAIIIDGTAYGPENFISGGSPVDPSGLTFGTNGSWLRFNNSANLGQDSSGNGNDWTLVNMDSSNQSTDVPT